MHEKKLQIPANSQHPSLGSSKRNNETAKNRDNTAVVLRFDKDRRERTTRLQTDSDAD